MSDLERVAGTARTYESDSQDRLVVSECAFPGRAPLRTEYDLDTTQNREQVTCGPDTDRYGMDPVPHAAGGQADAQVNQLTWTPWGDQLHDARGNVQQVGDGTGRTLVHDQANRLVKHVDSARGLVAQYDWDVLGRRTTRVVTQGPFRTERRALYDGDRLVEERDERGALLREVVGWPGLDAPLMVLDGHGRETWTLVDDQGSVRAVTDGEGRVLERIEYADYGEPLWLEGGPGGPIDELYLGRPYDTETGLYWVRARMLDPRTGRWMERDPLGLWGDAVNLGNGHAYAGNNPRRYVDRTGLEASDPANVTVTEDEPFYRAADGKRFTNMTTYLAYAKALNAKGMRHPQSAPQGNEADERGYVGWWLQGMVESYTGPRDAMAAAAGAEYEARAQARLPDFSRRAARLELGDDTDGHYAPMQESRADVIEQGKDLTEASTKLACDTLAEAVASKGLGVIAAPARAGDDLAALGVRAERAEVSAARRMPRDFATPRTLNRSAMFRSEGEARALAREKLGHDPIDIGDNKLRSQDGRWQYRAKAADLEDNHVHLERLDSETGEVLENWHLNFPQDHSR